jgi:DNA phosphorothioation-associated putative methyltransferase
MEIQSGKTAITRQSLSLPLRRLIHRHYLERERHAVFDYGHGRGDDMRELAKRDFVVGGWDPNHRVEGFSFNWPVEKEHGFNFVYCGYVLNVIESPELRLAAVKDIFDFLPGGGQAGFGVRSMREVARAKTDGWVGYSDGWVTSTSTFQHGFTPGELVDLLCEAGFRVMHVLEREPVIVWTRK